MKFLRQPLKIFRRYSNSFQVLMAYYGGSLRRPKTRRLQMVYTNINIVRPRDGRRRQTGWKRRTDSWKILKYI